MEDLGRKRTSGIFDQLQFKAPTSKRQRMSSTCEWINSEPAYKTWLTSEFDPNPILWIHGPSGFGKSFLSQHIVDQLEQDAHQPACLSYFCDEYSSPDSILLSILDQIHKNPKIGEEIKDEVAVAQRNTHYDRVFSHDAIFNMWEKLEEILGTVPLSIVVDGLDELPDHHLDRQGFNLPARLVELVKRNVQVKLLLSSRDDSDISNVFQPFPQIEITKEKVYDDLKTFITNKTTSLSQNENEIFRQELDSKLLEESKGNFIWAHLAIKMLRLQDGIDESDFQKLNGSLDDIYTRLYENIIKRLHHRDKILLDSIFQWTIYSIRQISPAELANAISVSKNIFISDIEVRVDQLTDSLIQVENGMLRPWHSSLRNFLMAEHHILGDRFHKQEANLVIAQACLTYLSHQSFRFDSIDSKSTLQPQLFPLLEYATLYYVHHITQSKSENSLKALIKTFFNSTNAFMWADVLLEIFISKSTLSIPWRSGEGAIIGYLAVLKGQLVNYFDEIERNEANQFIADWLCNCYERELAIERDWSLDPEHEDVVTKSAIRRMLHLAEVYDWLPGKRKQSQDLLQETFDSLSKFSASDADHNSVAISVYQAFGDGLKRAGKYHEAKKIYQFLRLKAQEWDCITDPIEMTVLDSMGWVCMRLDELTESAIYLQSSLELASTLYGSQSPQTLRSKLTLAEVYAKLGHEDQVHTLCSELLTQVRQRTSNGIPLPRDSVTQLNTLAAVYEQLGKFKDAADVYQAVVHEREALFGPLHSMTLWATLQLGTALAQAGEKNQAHQLLQNLLPSQISVLGEDHPDVLETRSLLASLSA